MKSAVMTCFSALVALSMTGCPIYPSDNRCRSDWDCAPGYACNGVTGACFGADILYCSGPADCEGPSETCGRNSMCVVGSCHLENVGCVAGYTCVGGLPESGQNSSSAWSCVPSGSVVTGVGGTSSIEDAGANNGDGGPASAE